jgi:glycosyltransferase involved in cell wall biosynthesis
VTDLSIVFGTYNRLELLRQCVESIRRSVGDISYEIVITDGGSTDGSFEWLQKPKQLDVAVIREEERRGAVAAFNDAAMASVGRYIAAVNDDVELVGSALKRAVEILDSDFRIGQVAMAYSQPGSGQEEFKVSSFHRHTYANLGVLRRRVYDEVVKIQGGLWNPIYHTYGGDTELSCWVWRLGWRVHEGYDTLCIDHLAQDILRKDNNSGRNHLDGKRCHTRWPDHTRLEPMGPEPLVEPHELEALRAYEGQKRDCSTCRMNFKRGRGEFCPEHGLWLNPARRGVR